MSDDDDVPALSAETFSALREYYAEQAKRQEILDKLECENKLKENVLFDENWVQDYNDWLNDSDNNWQSDDSNLSDVDSSDGCSDITFKTESKPADAGAHIVSQSKGKATGQPGARSHSINTTGQSPNGSTLVGRKGKPKQPLQGKGPSTQPPATVQTGLSRSAMRRWKQKLRRLAGTAGDPSVAMAAASGSAVKTAGAAVETSSCSDKGATLDSHGANPTAAISGGSTSGKKARSSKRPSKNKREAAKRARLEDTNSHQVEPKKQSRVNYAQKVQFEQYIAVTDDVTEHISQDLSTSILDEIEDKILREALTDSSKANPKFGGKPHYEDGCLKLFVEDEYSLMWLRECVAGLATPSDIKLVVKYQSECFRRVRCGVLIPNRRGKWKTASEIGAVLHYMNKWAQVDRWRFLKVDLQQDNLFVIVNVPEDVVPALVEKGRQLLFGTGAVYLKFQGPGGKFIRDPPVLPQTRSEVRPDPVCVTTPQSITPQWQICPGYDRGGSAAQHEAPAHLEDMLLGDDEPEPATMPFEGGELSLWGRPTKLKHRF